MRIQILRQADYTVSAWAGGVTTQLAIWPPQAQYAARSFDWRVSSAVVGAEESVFTRLPDYARHLAILDGQLRLRHNGGGRSRRTSSTARTKRVHAAPARILT